MADEIRVNRPAQQPVREPMVHNQMGDEAQPIHRGPSKTPWIILGVIVLLLIIGGIAFRDRIFGKKPQGPAKGVSAYQAVFLTNGQVYFGKVLGGDKNYVTLTDIYYLQVGPTQGSGATTTPSQQQIQLVKLGQELHGPVDEMHISRSQILFYEDLKEEGQVVKAIVQDKNAAK